MKRPNSGELTSGVQNRLPGKQWEFTWTIMPSALAGLLFASGIQRLWRDAAYTVWQTNHPPRVTVVVISRGREEAGRTFITVLRRYAECLPARGGRLSPAGYSSATPISYRRISVLLIDEV